MIRISDKYLQEELIPIPSGRKKLVNLKAALALHFAHYNFCRVHSTAGSWSIYEK